MDLSSSAWAVREFGHASLGDPRRVRRLVKIAESLVQHPAGRVTAAFGNDAEREGAYRLVSSTRFAWTDIANSMHVATAQRSADFDRVIVPVDGIAFTLSSRRGDFGPISNKTRLVRSGVQAMTALALTPDGVPLGLLAHRWWNRTSECKPREKTERRPIVERETVHWLRAIEQAVGTLQAHAPSTRPWFQLDRGGDSADVLLRAIELGSDVTVRACYDRVITNGRLWSSAAAGTFLGTHRIALSNGRVARMSVRAREVELHLMPGVRSRPNTHRTTMRVVEVRERCRGNDGICWRLLTTVPVRTMRDALHVITAYTRRWRIEEFHLAWKSGACAAEGSWMRKPQHFYKWATILSAVAARLERIKLLSRSEPGRPALDEYTRDEIDAVIALRKPKGVAFGARPTLGEVTRWIADIGGYTGKSSGGPPGIRVLHRGFERVESAAIAIASIRKDQRSRD
jgi:hypothetical protein